jgi:hypothetical protein
MSTDNFPLVQLAEAHGSHTNYPLIDSGTRYEDDDAGDDSTKSRSKQKVYTRPDTNDHLYDPSSDTRCRIDNPDFLACMRGLHGVQRLDGAPSRGGQLDPGDSSLENQSGMYQPPLRHEPSDKWKLDGGQIPKPGTFQDGHGKFWKMYLLFIGSFIYLKRKILQDWFTRHCEPLYREHVLPRVNRYVGSYRLRKIEDVDSDASKSDKKNKNKTNRNRKKSKEASTSEIVDPQANSTAIDIHTQQPEGADRSVSFAQNTKQEVSESHMIVDFSDSSTPTSNESRPFARYTMPPPMISSALSVSDTILGEFTCLVTVSKLLVTIFVLVM